MSWQQWLMAALSVYALVKAVRLMAGNVQPGPRDGYSAGGLVLASAALAVPAAEALWIERAGGVSDWVPTIVMGVLGVIGLVLHFRARASYVAATTPLQTGGAERRR